MTATQQKVYGEATTMRNAYGKGVFGYKLVDYVSGLGAPATSILAAAVVKFSESPHAVNLSVALSALSAILASVHKIIDPQAKLRRDWAARGAMHRLLVELDAEPDFNAMEAAKRMNRIIEEHDRRFI